MSSDPWWLKYQVPHIPEGKSGDWTIEKFSVSEEESDRTKLRAAMKGFGFVPAGNYTRLMYGKEIIMSDTAEEIETNSAPIRHCSKEGGHVLIAGLGLGVVARGVLMEKAVERVTVVEISPDVIKLVSPHLIDPRLEIIQSDIHEWEIPKGSHFSYAWFDIWGGYSGDDVKEMDKLKRRFRRWSDARACWQERYCRQRNRR